MLEQKGRMENERESLRAIGEGAGTPFWRSMQKKIKSKIEEVETSLDSYSRLTDNERVTLLERRIVLKYCLTLPDDAESGIEKISENISNLEREIETYRARLREYQ